MRPGSGLRAAGHEENRGQSAGLPGKDVDHLLLRGCQRLTFKRSQRAAQLEIQFARKRGAIGNGQASRDDMRFRNPIFGCGFKSFKRRETQPKKIWVKTAQARRCVKLRWV